MRYYPDATLLLRTLMDEHGHAFDPDSAVARASLERILATPPLTTTRQRRPSRVIYWPWTSSPGRWQFPPPATRVNCSDR